MGAFGTIWNRMSRLDLGSAEKNIEWFKTLRELVALLFAVVFAIGLEKLGKAESAFDYLILISVYLAILMSWWGYNLGIIAGPSESNRFCYFIDVLLLVLYWYMLHWSFMLERQLWLFSIMFALYALWEAMRFIDHRGSPDGIKIRAALRANIAFTIIFLLLVGSREFGLGIPDLAYVGCLAVLPWGYRIKVGRIYRESARVPMPKSELDGETLQRLADQAQTAAGRAKCHLSGFRVGAAIVTVGGGMYSGCNIEFDNYSNTLHAEEVAIGNMIASGDRNPIAIAVYTEAKSPAFPCGMCLQSLLEVGSGDLIVLALTPNGRDSRQMRDLLPHGFRL